MPTLNVVQTFFKLFKSQGLHKNTLITCVQIDLRFWSLTKLVQLWIMKLKCDNVFKD